MKIVVIGSGYVGLVSGVCFSEFGFSVTCVDKDKNKIKALQNGEVPIYEPGLEDLLKRNVEARRLDFTSDLEISVSKADIVFIAVGTPSRRGDGHADLSYVYEASREIAKSLQGYTTIVTKSTVPVGTGRKVKSIINKENPKVEFDVVSNPEFLREGSAIEDFMRPDRVIVGLDSKKSEEIMKNLYRPLYLLETPILFTTLESSELIKYASNAFLAIKISYINQIADLCESVGANVGDVAKGMGLDKRIGSKFLHAGPGYGGSCFPKDTLALVKTANDNGKPISLVNETIKFNDNRKYNMFKKIKDIIGNLSGINVAILGLSFKPETDDMRDSPSIEIIEQLIKAKAILKAYDPAAMNEAKKVLPKSIHYVTGTEECLNGADITVILTEWNEFRALEPEFIFNKMKGDIVVDLRNIFNPLSMKNAGLHYISIGR